MAYFMTPNVTADNSAFPLRQAEGKVLGRVRSLVKGSTPRAGVKDYRFFVDPLSSLPPEMGEGPRFGFTGFMSRSGYGFNAFAGEEEALARLQEDLGGSFVTFTPALRNNKFFVLDDLKRKDAPLSWNKMKITVPFPLLDGRESLRWKEISINSAAIFWRGNLYPACQKILEQ